MLIGEHYAKTRYVWSRVGGFLLKLQALGLGHDAVIEAMIAILGVIVAVFTLVAGLITILIAVAAFFGYGSLTEQTIQAAVKRADEIATQVATQRAEAALEQSRLREQGSSIVEAVPPPAKKAPAASKPKRTTRMMNDASLKRGTGGVKDDGGRTNNKQRPKNRAH